MELVHYLRIVRRRWRVVAAFCVIGALLGVATSLLTTAPKVPGTTYYLAKHTLSSSDGTANLNRDAVLCTEGDVPKRVAAKIGFDNSLALAAKVTCEAHPETNLLYIAATDTDSKRSVLIADSFAEQLVVYLREVGEKQKAAKVDVIKKQIEGLETSYQQVKAELAASPDRKDLLQARLNDLAAQSNTLRDKQNVAESQPASSESLTTLSTAEAVAISQGAFDSLNAGDPSKKAGAQATGINTATRQSQIDAAIKSGNTLGKTTRGGLGAALGLLLGVALVIVLDRIDPRIRTKFEAEEAFGWPVIGEIPPLTRSERQSMALLAFDEPRSRAAEAYRVLRSALLFATTPTELDPETHPIFANIGAPAPSGTAGPSSSVADAAPANAASTPPVEPDPAEATTAPRGQVIMVTSPGPSEGKTTTAANMAAILGETGRSVIVINCDFRRPRIHLYLGAPEGGRQVIETRVPNVKLVTQVLDNPHDANPAEVVAVQRQVIRNAREMFDIVLLDTAPLLTTNDATEVLAVADQVVVVAKTGKTHKEAADRAAELLERRGGPVVGVVLVGATDVPTSRYYYYGDTPDREEPEPGAEETSPLDALLATTAAEAATAPSAPVSPEATVDAATAASASSRSDAPSGAVVTAPAPTVVSAPETTTPESRLGTGPGDRPAPGPGDASTTSDTAGTGPRARKHDTPGSTGASTRSPSRGAPAGGTTAPAANGAAGSAADRSTSPTSSASPASPGSASSSPPAGGSRRRPARTTDSTTSAGTPDPAPVADRVTDVTPTTPAAPASPTAPAIPATPATASTTADVAATPAADADRPRSTRAADTGPRTGTPAGSPSRPGPDAALDAGNPLDALAGEKPARGRRGRLRGRSAAPTPADDFPAELIAFDAPDAPPERDDPSAGPTPGP